MSSYDIIFFIYNRISQ